MSDQLYFPAALIPEKNPGTH